MTSPKISIIGFGWLGLPLATHLLKLGYAIKGSTTSEEKRSKFLADGLNCYQVILHETNVEGEIEACLSGSDVLILNTPPGLRRNPSSNYITKIKALIPYIESSSISNVIFIGSTAVFNDTEDFQIITNNTLPNSEKNSGIQLREVEQILTNNPNFKTTILRFAGLVDERRHPASMISKRPLVPNPKAPLNLIHREDCIGIITQIISQEKWNSVYNACFPNHLEKESYYTDVCSQLNLPKPNYNHTIKSLGKLIDGNDTAKDLNYEYKHPIN